MKLQEIIAEILQRKFAAIPETQRPRALAKVLDVGEMDARRLIVAGRNQEKQFAIFMKLLPLCEELGIDPARELSTDTASSQQGKGKAVDDGIRKALSVSKEIAAGSVSRSTPGGKKHFPPSSIGGNQRRKSGQK